MAAYEPPFAYSDTIAALLLQIGELAERVSVTAERAAPMLRRENRIRSIYSTLAIEQNTLSPEQVTAVLNGKRVLAPPKDIREVQNAYEAYEHLSELDPYSMNDLLKAHAFMMADLTREAGCFRSGDVGVYRGGQLLHPGTPAAYVPEVMQQLFDWLRTSRLPLLLKSCIFHYEFEFIHPFSDGNGRTGRLWHSLLLSRWKLFFMWLPVETLIRERQQDYYAAINTSNDSGNSTVFVEFMLTTIRDTLAELNTDNVVNNVVNNVANDVVNNVVKSPTEREMQCLELLRRDPHHTARTLSEAMGVTVRQAQRILASLKAKNLVERIGRRNDGYWKVH